MISPPGVSGLVSVLSSGSYDLGVLTSAVLSRSIVDDRLKSSYVIRCSLKVFETVGLLLCACL